MDYVGTGVPSEPSWVTTGESGLRGAAPNSAMALPQDRAALGRSKTEPPGLGNRLNPPGDQGRASLPALPALRNSRVLNR